MQITDMRRLILDILDLFKEFGETNNRILYTSVKILVSDMPSLHIDSKVTFQQIDIEVKCLAAYGVLSCRELSKDLFVAEITEFGRGFLMGINHE